MKMRKLIQILLWHFKICWKMFVKHTFKKTKTKTIIFRLFNTYGPGENLNFLKKGMVSIYLSYVWKNKPILVKVVWIE